MLDGIVGPPARRQVAAPLVVALVELPDQFHPRVGRQRVLPLPLTSHRYALLRGRMATAGDAGDVAIAHPCRS